jgi:hypothetical protein
VSRPPVPVTAICGVAFFAAVLGSSLVVSDAARSGRAALNEDARDLVEALQGSRADDDRVRAHLAPGVSLNDPRVDSVLGSLIGHEGRVHVARVRVTDDGTRGVTELASEGAMARRAGSDIELNWVRAPGGRWGFEPISR